MVRLSAISYMVIIFVGQIYQYFLWLEKSLPPKKYSHLSNKQGGWNRWRWWSCFFVYYMKKRVEGANIWGNNKKGSFLNFFLFHFLGTSTTLLIHLLSLKITYHIGKFPQSIFAFWTWKLKRPSKPGDDFLGQPLTHRALPFCIAIEILCLR